MNKCDNFDFYYFILWWLYFGDSSITAHYHDPKQIDLFFLIKKWNLALLDAHQSIYGVPDTFLPLGNLHPFICQTLQLSTVLSLALPSLPFLSIPSTLVLFIPCLSYCSLYLWLVFLNFQPLCLQVTTPFFFFCPVTTHMLDILPSLSLSFLDKITF